MRRRTALVAIAGAALAATTSSGSAGGIPPRSVSVPYEQPAGVVLALPGGFTWVNVVTDHQIVEAQRGERAVSVTIDDASGASAHGDLHINLDGDRKLEVHESFCGSTPKPVRVRPGAEIEVRAYAGQCADGSPAVATRGTIEITFHK